MQDTKNKGIYIVLAAERTIKSTLFNINQAFSIHYIIANNGGVIYEMEGDKVVYDTKIDLEEGFTIFNAYKEQSTLIHMCLKWYYYRYTKEKGLSAQSSIIKILDFQILRDIRIQL